jgi:hypothetical protein
MKYWGTLILTLCVMGVYAQNQDAKVKAISAKSVSVDKNIVKLYQDANFKSDKFEIKHADSIIFDENSEKMKIYGYKEIAFDGLILDSVKDKSKATRLDYHLGDDYAVVRIDNK